MTKFVALTAGLLLAAAPAFAGKADEAAKYTEDLKTSKDVKVRIIAAQEIGKLAEVRKTYGKDAVPYLIEACKDRDPGMRAAAAEALGKSYTGDEESVVTLLTNLSKDDGDGKVRIGAIRGLGALGPKAKAALPVLKEMLTEENKDKKSPLRGPLRETVNLIMERAKK
jgi:HEAT repeat protein